jgi:prevent-host-death family protein
MPHPWQLQEAKNKLSEVLDRAETEGPQTITRRGTAAAVVLSMKEYRKLIRSDAADLVRFFQKSPLRGQSLDLERSKDTGRDIDL